MEHRTCSKCKIEKPLTLEFYHVAHKNKARFHTECRVCKKNYMKKWQEQKRLVLRDTDNKREKHMYTIKEVSVEDKKQRMREAYAYLHYQAFGRPISQKQLKDLEGIEE